MSPPLDDGSVFEAGVAVVEGDPAIESLIELHCGAGEAEAAVLRWNLEAMAIPLHDVVVADHSFMKESTNALQIVWRWTPGLGGVAGGMGEAAIVLGDELAQHGVGGVDVGSISQAQFAA